MGRINWDKARHVKWAESIYAPADDILGLAVLGYCRDGTCKEGRYYVPIDTVVGLLVAASSPRPIRVRGRRGDEWDEAREEVLRKGKVRKLLLDFCPFHVTYTIFELPLVRSEVWRRGGGVGNPDALRRIEVRAVNVDLELVPVVVALT